MTMLLIVLERMIRDKSLSVKDRRMAYKLMKDLINHRGLLKAGERKVVK